MAALTINQQRLIEAIADNDLLRIKQFALRCLDDDKTKNNESFVASIKERLIKEPTRLPTNIEGKLICCLPENFMPERYYKEPAWINDTLQEIVRMKSVASMMEAMHIRYSNSTILYGESGTGKTEFGRYVAHKLNLPFYYFNFSNIVDSTMGSTGKNMSLIFNYAKSTECVLMLDEIDCLACKRDTGGSAADKEISRITISLIQELDTLPNNIILLAATNRLDVLDTAVLNRFSIRQEVKRLSTDDNREFAQFYVKAIGAQSYISDYDIDSHFSQLDMSQRRVIAKIIQFLGEKIYETKEYDKAIPIKGVE